MSYGRKFSWLKQCMNYYATLMRPSPRRSHYALHPVRLSYACLSFPCPPSTQKWKSVQRSNLVERLPTCSSNLQSNFEVKRSKIKVTGARKRRPRIALAVEAELTCSNRLRFDGVIVHRAVNNQDVVKMFDGHRNVVIG